MSRDDAFSRAIARARSHAPFLAMLLDREPALAARLAGGAMPPLAIDPDLPVGTALRRARRQLALGVAIADLAGAMDLTDVTAALSDFADRAIHAALAAAIAERTPGEPVRGFAVLALGKLGSRELNYSSDVDPILIYDPATLPCRPREDAADAAVRIARRMVELLQARDGDGYVLRVDLRLRPSPEVTPPAVPLEPTIAYYESQALAWERAAFIRARPCAGDLALGEAFLAQIRPFVWRRSLDFGAIGEILSISGRIRDHHAQGQAFGPGYDLKRGRGGIREIEFFAQIHQLIHGGREPSLRAPATRDALSALAAAGRIATDTAAALSDHYTRLRTVEHRIQMVDDRQTHQLPAGDALDGLARLDGLDDAAALLADLAPRTRFVARTYDALDRPEAEVLPDDPDRLAARLGTLGFADGAAGAAIVGGWRAGRYPALRSPAARSALEAVLPALLRALGEAADARAAIVALDRLLERLPSAVNLFRLIEARPGLGATLAAILSHAPTLSDELARRADLLDGLIDASAFDPVPPVPALAAEMRAGARPDFEARLEHVRRVVGERRFALGAQIVSGGADPLTVAAGYARVAEAAIVALADATIKEFAAAHGRVPDSELLILALGRMGGGAMTHASDLDLIYLFTGDFGAESDGRKPLGATLYYNRLAQRVTAALSVPTAAGPLYSVDTRLRPSGTQGPLVVSVDSFERYQRESAWTWERMALARGRPVYGSPAARDALERIVRAALLRDSGADIAADAAAMRAEMAAHKPPSGPLDAKLLPGGLVDLEFAVHVRQLVHGIGLDPDLGCAIDALVAAGLIPGEARAAHDLLTRWLVTMRLVAPDAEAPPPATAKLIARALGLADWPAALAAFEATRQRVIAMAGEGGDAVG